MKPAGLFGPAARPGRPRVPRQQTGAELIGFGHELVVFQGFRKFWVADITADSCVGMSWPLRRI